jgi:hypothetical protein
MTLSAVACLIKTVGGSDDAGLGGRPGSSARKALPTQIDKDGVLMNLLAEAVRQNTLLHR